MSLIVSFFSFENFFFIFEFYFLISIYTFVNYLSYIVVDKVSKMKKST